jgi:hypothetical protein
VTIPPVVAIAVPIAMPIPRDVSENVFLPVTAQMIVAIPKIIRAPQVVSIPELCVSLIPNARDSWISAIRDWRDTIALLDSCYCVWTGTRDPRSTRINSPPVRERW